MKREIKFRAWDKISKILLPVEVLTHAFVTLDPKNNDDEGNYSYEVELKDCELMQYTGLKDKNGVEIYEGDIVEIEFDFGYGDCKVNAEVIFKDAGYQFDSKAGCAYGADKAGKVIGNKYENPELLED